MIHKPILGKTASNIFVIAYLLGTLFFRFKLEEQIAGHTIVSLALGGFALLFLWALYKSGYIRPSLLGLGAKD
ncbi:MAG: hypothetical protein R2792_08115 [Saprospiraceae bacterium]